MNGIKIFALLLSLGVLALILPRGESTPRQRFLGLKSHLGLKGDNPLLLIYGDGRSRQARAFLTAIETEIEREQYPLDLVVMSSSSTAFGPDRNATLRIEPDRFLQPATTGYFLFEGSSDGGVSGSLAEEPKVLRQYLWERFKGSHDFFADLANQSGTNLRDSPFSFLSEQVDPSESVKSVFIFFDDVCMVCESGKQLLTLDEVQKRFPDHYFGFVTLADYPEDQRDLYVEEHRIGIPVLSADEVFRTFWEGFRSAHTARHPLEGLLLGVDGRGTVHFLGPHQQLQGVIEWLEGSSPTPK